MKPVLALMFFFSGVLRAEIVTSAAAVEHGAGYSCRILRHRVKDRVKGHAGLHALLQKMEERGGWNGKGMKRLTAHLGRSGYFPKYYFERTVKISVRWAVPLEWAALLNTGTVVAAGWSFKNIEWHEERGIMPDEVESVWHSGNSELQVSTRITPLQLCYDSPDLRMWIGSEDKVLELQSRVDWL